MKALRAATRRIRFLLHYALVRQRRDARDLALLASSDYFDARYYLDRYADVAQSGMDPLLHYVDHGAAELRRPSRKFDTNFYVKTTPDAGTLNPLVHFLRHGLHANRPSLPAPFFYEGKARRPDLPAPARRSRYEDPLPEPAPARPRFVIFTAVTGGYDDLPPPGFFPPNCDFVAFSDRPIQVDGWKVLPLNYQHPDPAKSARFVKLHPHLYFPDHEVSLWIDGNVRMIGDVGVFVDALPSDGVMGTFVHPLRDCIYDEGMECLEFLKDDEAIVCRQLDFYREQGIPDSLGLWETNVVVRRHNDARCIELMTAWWREVENGSRRDQLSLPVVQRRLGIPISPLDVAGASARNHPLLTYADHRSQRARTSAAWPPPERPVETAPPSSPVTIGVCVHNSLAEVRTCLASVLEARGSDDLLLIVDDASGEETAHFLADFAANHPRVVLVRNPQNLGYTKSANTIFRTATTDWILLLNSDTVLPPDTLKKLLAAGAQYDRLAMVGPLSNAASWQTVPTLTGADGGFMVNDLPAGRTPRDMDRICGLAALPVVQFAPLVNGFCLAIRRSILERVGLFDEENFPVGYGEEDDLCLRVADAGFVCGITTDAYVFHVKSASFGSERRAKHAAEGATALHRKHSRNRLEAATAVMRGNPGLRTIRERLSAALHAKAKAT